MSNLELATSLYLNQQPQAALKIALADIGPLFNLLAASAQSLGHSGDAQRYWRMVLQLEPRNHDAYNNLGLLSMGKGEFAEAEQFYQQAIALKPDFAEAFSNFGLLMQTQQRIDESLSALQRAVALKPDFAEAHNNLGELLMSQGRGAEAVLAFQAALAQSPQFIQAAFNLALLEMEQKHWAAAEKLLVQIVNLKPDHGDALNNLGVVYRTLERLEESALCYRQALALKPDSAIYMGNLGEVLFHLGQLGEAESFYLKALQTNPDFLDAWLNLSQLHIKEKRWPEAEASIKACLRIMPDHAPSLNNLGVIYENQLKYEAAEAAYLQASILDPSACDFLVNLGAVRAGRKDFSNAEPVTRQALSINPDQVFARINLGFILLHQGRYEEAWPYYEARYQPELGKFAVQLPQLPFPYWQGESLEGKHLLIWHEQGFGDDIQFCRYVPILKAMGAGRIDMVSKPPLLPLLETLSGIDSVYPHQEDTQLPAADFWTFPMSMPRLLKLTPENIPASLPYLRALPERIAKWQNKLPQSRVKIGLFWKGYSGYDNDAHRSLPSLETLAPLASVPGIQFISLQKGAAEAEALTPPPGMKLFPVGPELEDFADTAAVIEQLDLVITVDTAVGHLTGALGKPCWILLPFFKTDWRWMQERPDSPWYPQAVRLFRQAEGESWDAVIERVTQALWGRFAVAMYELDYSDTMKG